MKDFSTVSHRGILKKLLKDERLSPNRRLLGEMLHLWLDLDDPEEKSQMLKLIQATYGSPNRTLWKDGTSSPDLIPTLSKIEAEATAKLKDYFAQIQEDAEEMQNEISTEEFQSTS